MALKRGIFLCATEVDVLKVGAESDVVRRDGKGSGAEIIRCSLICANAFAIRKVDICRVEDGVAGSESEAFVGFVIEGRGVDIN